MELFPTCPSIARPLYCIAYLFSWIFCRRLQPLRHRIFLQPSKQLGVLKVHFFLLIYCHGLYHLYFLMNLCVCVCNSNLIAGSLCPSSATLWLRRAEHVALSGGMSICCSSLICFHSTLHSDDLGHLPKKNLAWVIYNAPFTGSWHAIGAVFDSAARSVASKVREFEYSVMIYWVCLIPFRISGQSFLPRFDWLSVCVRMMMFWKPSFWYCFFDFFGH